MGVVGIGAQTSVGRTAPESAAAVRAKVGNVAEHPYMFDNSGEPVKVARASWLSDDLTVTARMLALAEGAAEEALQPLQKANQVGKPSLAILVGTPTAKPGLSEELARALKNRLSELSAMQFKLLSFETCPNGHAAGVVALQRGWRLILKGNVDFCLVGGVDSYLDPERLLEIEARKQLHSDSNSWGFIPGEAAGFCLLASQESIRKFQLSPVLEVLTVAVAQEANTIHSKTVCTGAGLGQAVEESLKACPAEKVQQIVCDQNGETFRADEFGFTITRFGRRFPTPPNFWTPADCWGDVGAASAPLFAALIAASGQRGYAKGEYGLVLTSSETGERGAAIMRILAPSRR